MLNQPNILVCTDFSPASDKALKEAHRLAKASGGKLYLLHVAQFPAFFNSEENLLYEIMVARNCRRFFQEQMERCKVKAETVMYLNMPLMTYVSKTIQEIKADLLVISDKGSSDEGSFFIGSTAKKLVSGAKIPVYVVKHESPVKKVGALVDGQEDFRKIIDWGNELSFLTSSKLTVISLVSRFPELYHNNVIEFARTLLNAINQDTEKKLDYIKNRIIDSLGGQQADLIVSASYERNVGYHLTEILHDEDVQLVVMQRHHRPSVEKFILGSVSHTVIDRFNGNILIV